VHALKIGVAPMPSSTEHTDDVLQLAATHKLKGPIYELGAGWGSLAFDLARRFPQKQVVAYELSWIPYLYMSVLKLVVRRPNLVLKRADFMKDDLSNAGSVVMFLSPPLLEKLEPKLKADLKKGALVLANTFMPKGWTPKETKGKISVFKV